MQKIWSTAPIPFTGQKRHFLKQLREAITPIVQPDTIIIDLFGGSGLMAHNAKRWFPNNRVIWNDYDGYADRLARTDETNKALQAMREATLPYRKEQSIPVDSEAGKQLCEILRALPADADFRTLANNINFSGSQQTTAEGIIKEKFWKRIRKADLPDSAACADYLDGLTIIHDDFRTILAEYKGGAGPDPRRSALPEFLHRRLSRQTLAHA